MSSVQDLELDDLRKTYKKGTPVFVRNNGYGSWEQAVIDKEPIQVNGVYMAALTRGGTASELFPIQPALIRPIMQMMTTVARHSTPAPGQVDSAKGGPAEPLMGRTTFQSKDGERQAEKERALVSRMSGMPYDQWRDIMRYFAPQMAANGGHMLLMLVAERAGKILLDEPKRADSLVSAISLTLMDVGIKLST